MQLVTAAEMRRIEMRSEEEGLSIPLLMEKAGHAVAQEVRAILGGSVQGASILVLVGPGNNGGDGLVAARHLHDWGAQVIVFCLVPRHLDDVNFRLVRHRGIPCYLVSENHDLALLRTQLARVHLVLDALLGTGPRRPIEGALKQVLDVLRAAKAARPALRLVALDLPTGLATDTGEVDPATVPADITLTLGFPKVGLYTFPGAAFTGEVRCLDIGLPLRLAADVPTELLTEEVARALLPPRPRDSHKGTFGRVLVVGGSLNYIGAPALAALGAGRAGAGLVTLATPRTVYPLVASHSKESTFLPLPDSEAGALVPEAVPVLQEVLGSYEALVLGCGLGQQPGTALFLERLLDALPQFPQLSVLLDADGLNLLAPVAGWHERLPQNAVLTPHPGEMARLLGRSTTEVQAARLGTAREAAKRWGVTVVLKGACTVVAEREGQARVSPFATSALATAGTGDVLAGVIGGLLAQGLRAFDAASLGVYLHGAAGMVVARELGEAGTLAGDLLTALPRVVRELRRNAATTL
jgi:hydroxyethylthiazole kinase-like uncharacterized protein yjeF